MKTLTLAGLTALTLTVTNVATADAFTIQLNNQWYEISAFQANTSPRTSPNALESLALLSSQPWYGSEDLAKSAAAQVAAQFSSGTLFIENLPELGPPVCDWNCNIGNRGVFFAWDITDEEEFINDGNPSGPTSLGTYRNELVATFHSSDEDVALGYPPILLEEKFRASDHVYAIATAIDDPNEAVPEPGMLLGAGLGLWGLATRKRSKS